MGTDEIVSDGGEDVRRVQEYLHPFSEHLIDWFHITMKLTVLQQQLQGWQEERPETGADVSQRVESVKHLVWHGNTEEALERLNDLIVELSWIEARSPIRSDSVAEVITVPVIFQALDPLRVDQMSLSRPLVDTQFVTASW